MNRSSSKVSLIIALFLALTALAPSVSKAASLETVFKPDSHINAPTGPRAALFNRLQLALPSKSSPKTLDAYAYLQPTDGNTFIHVGDVITISLMVDTGTNVGVAAQSYVRYDTNKFVNVDTQGNPSNVVDMNLDTFEFWLQNQVCIGPDTCSISGHKVPPGFVAYASGTQFGYPTGRFEVAKLHLRALTTGSASMIWQFIHPYFYSWIIDPYAQQISVDGRYYSSDISIRPASH